MSHERESKPLAKKTTAKAKKHAYEGEIDPKSE